MARKKKTMSMAPMEYTPPTPQQQFDYAMRETVEKAAKAPSKKA